MKGFPEGTTYITYGDPIKDPRRHKNKCKFFRDGICEFDGSGSKTRIKRNFNPRGLKCRGSSHCAFYKT